jgi:secernin
LDVLLAPSRLLFACDTWAALRDVVRNGVTLLGKNSDRPIYDCQPLMFYPHKKWPTGTTINMGRIEIPQVEETFANIGSSPYWCWGYEEGMNEFGVAIGNEGVFSKDLSEKIRSFRESKVPALGLTGMDLVRLGLERGRTARESLDVMIDLLEKYGQFGSGIPGLGLEGAYDNSYIIADPMEVWILETSGKIWIARKQTQGIASISNKLGLSTEWDISSPDLIDYAVKKGWWPEEKQGSFDFEKAYIDDSDEGKLRNDRASIRQLCSYRLLDEKKGDVTVDWMKKIARNRSSNPSLDLDQTASSCVAVLPSGEKNLPVFWWCAATPSRSCYIPFFVHGSKIPEIVSTAGTFGKKVTVPGRASRDSFSEDSFWWLFRDLCDKVNLDRDKRYPRVREVFDDLEEKFASGLPELIKKAIELRNSGQNEEASLLLDSYTSECVQKAVEKANELREIFQSEDQDIPEGFKPFVGTYIANFGPFQNAEFKVAVRKDKLAVDIPGQMMVDLKEPDKDGLRYFEVTDRVAVSFDKNESGEVTALKFHQASVLPRKKDSAPEISDDIPTEMQPYLGKYTVPMQNREYTVIFQKNRLALDIPGQMVVELEPPDDKGRLIFSIDSTTSVSFDWNQEEAVTAMRIHQIFTLIKKKPDEDLSPDQKNSQGIQEYK